MSRKVSEKSRIYPGNDFENRCVFSRWRNVDNNSTDMTSEGRSFNVCVATTGKTRSATDDRLMGGTTRQLVSVEWRNRRPGEWVVGGIVVWVRARPCTPGRRSWPDLAPWCAASADSLTRQRCGRIGGGDMSVAFSTDRSDIVDWLTGHTFVGIVYVFLFKMAGAKLK